MDAYETKGGTCNFHQKNRDDQMFLADKDVNVIIKDSDFPKME